LDQILRHRKSGEEEVTVEEPCAGPPVKCRKTTKRKNIHRTSFDAHPSQMSSQLPKSGKSTVLYDTMVEARWLDEHKSEVKVENGADWLRGFRERVHDGDLVEEDRTYLDELEEWIADEEDNTQDAHDN